MGTLRFLLIKESRYLVRVSSLYFSFLSLFLISVFLYLSVLDLCKDFDHVSEFQAFRVRNFLLESGDVRLNLVGFWIIFET